MEIKVFCRSQLEVAEAINNIINSYWRGDIKEKLMIENLNRIINNNYEKLIRGGRYTKTIEQRCGKKRLEIVSKIRNLQDL